MTNFKGERLTHQQTEEYGEGKRVTTTILENDANNIEYLYNLQKLNTHYHSTRKIHLQPSTEWTLGNSQIITMNENTTINSTEIPKQNIITFKTDTTTAYTANIPKISIPEGKHITRITMPVFTTGTTTEKKKILSTDYTLIKYTVLTLDDLLNTSKYNYINSYAEYLGITKPSFTTTDELVDWVDGKIDATKNKSTRYKFVTWLLVGEGGIDTDDKILIGIDSTSFFGYPNGIPCHGFDNIPTPHTEATVILTSDNTTERISNPTLTTNTGAKSNYIMYDSTTPSSFMTQTQTKTNKITEITVTCRNEICSLFRGNIDLTRQIELFDVDDAITLNNKAIKESIIIIIDANTELIQGSDFTVKDDGKTILFNYDMEDNSQLTVMYQIDYDFTVDYDDLNNFIIQYTVNRKDNNDVGYILEGEIEYE